MTLWQARKMVVTGFQTCPLGIVGDPGSFRFSFDNFELGARSRWGKDFQHYKVDMKSLPRFPQNAVLGECIAKRRGRKRFSVNHLAWQCQEPAESVAKAINHLRNMAGEQGLALRNLPQAAAAWRALSPKPPLPEEVRAQRLLAETAFKEGKLGKALYHYENGVELYPVWPEGRFNAALMAAELKFYSEAVEHMRAYLELVPDSPDAPSARDQIVIWQDKATEKARESMQDQPQTPGLRGRSEGRTIQYPPSARGNRMTRLGISLVNSSCCFLRQRLRSGSSCPGTRNSGDVRLPGERNGCGETATGIDRLLGPVEFDAHRHCVQFRGLEFQAAPNHDGPNADMVYAVPKKLFPPGLYTVDLKILGEATHKIWNADPRISYIEIDGRSPFAKENRSNAGILGLLWWLQDEKAALAFANAINSLRLSARAYDASRGPSPVCFADKDTKALFWAEFHERAATWRALPSKPPDFGRRQAAPSGGRGCFEPEAVRRRRRGV